MAEEAKPKKTASTCQLKIKQPRTRSPAHTHNTMSTNKRAKTEPATVEIEDGM